MLIETRMRTLCSVGFLMLLTGICHGGTLDNELKNAVNEVVKDLLQHYEVTSSELKSEVAHLTKVVAAQEKRIRGLEKTVEELLVKSDKESVQHSTEMPGEIGDKATGGNNANVDETEIELKDIKAHIDVNNDNNSDKISSILRPLKTPRSSVESVVPGRRQVTANVAFCAYLDHVLNHLSIGQIIKYNQVILNDGAAYNTHTGVFTAPATGVYLFMFHYDSYYGKTEIRLVIDDVNVVGSVVDHIQTDYHVMGGNSAIVKVWKGQSVWTEPYYASNQELDSTSVYRKTTFSGVLLYFPE